jgi:hypothetical protein
MIKVFGPMETEEEEKGKSSNVAGEERMEDDAKGKKKMEE